MTEKVFNYKSLERQLVERDLAQFNPTDPFQQKIYRRLYELDLPLAAAFFRDAAWIMEHPQFFHAGPHLFIYCLREVNTILLESLWPKVLRMLENAMQRDQLLSKRVELLQERWGEITDELELLSSHEPTHISKMLDTWEQFQGLLYIVLDACRPLAQKPA